MRSGERAVILCAERVLLRVVREWFVPLLVRRSWDAWHCFWGPKVVLGRRFRRYFRTVVAAPLGGVVVSRCGLFPARVFCRSGAFSCGVFRKRGSAAVCGG